MTHRDEAPRAALPPLSRRPESNAQASLTPPRARLPLESVTDRVRRALQSRGRAVAEAMSPVRLWRLGQARRAARPHVIHSRASLWAEAPPSIAEVVTRIRAGLCIPGEEAPAIEAAGKAYGYLVAVPATAALYATAWVLQRPGRLAVAVLVAGITWLTL